MDYTRAWAIVKYANAAKPSEVSEGRWRAMVRFIRRVLSGEISEPTSLDTDFDSLP